MSKPQQLMSNLQQALRVQQQPLSEPQHLIPAAEPYQRALAVYEHFYQK
jgi:hypothetical protein